MKDVLIVGAGGSIAREVIDMLLPKKDLQLTLYLRKASRLDAKFPSNARIVEGDVMDMERLREAMTGQDIVYINLAGDLEAMTKNIVWAMKEKGVRRVILISSIGIYDKPLPPVLRPYRAAADVIESSGLDYTVIRPTWFTNDNEVSYALTRKGEAEKGSVVSRKSVAAFIAGIIVHSEKYVGENFGISKPGY